MAYKQKGWSPFTRLDDKNTQVKIKKFISENMNKMSDVDLMKKVREMSDNKTEYNWNNKTGEVEAHDSPAKQMVFTHGPTDGVTGKDIETKEEAHARYNTYTYTPSVAEVLRKRKGEEAPPKPKDPIHRFLDENLPK
tara:strand:- start:574 stop:984 length:411 start_codon:yes stop_codon:yes gene_type:complete